MKTISALLALALTIALAACATAGKSAATDTATGKSEVVTRNSGAGTGKSGAQLWAENCNRCHNVRSPQSYSPTQWEVALLHMRVRANLTPEEHTKILAFLKSAD